METSWDKIDNMFPMIGSTFYGLNETRCLLQCAFVSALSSGNTEFKSSTNSAAMSASSKTSSKYSGSTASTALSRYETSASSSVTVLGKSDNLQDPHDVDTNVEQSADDGWTVV